mgnify:CR=1 FL=1
MDKEQLIRQMVDNYYAQVAIVGSTSLTLEEYLRGIFKHSPTEYTEADVQYGLSLAR